MVAEKFTAEVELSNATVLKFDNNSFLIGPEVGDIVFQKTTENGSKLIDAINKGQNFKLTLFNDNFAFSSTSLFPSRGEQRDFLYKGAQYMIDTEDPRYCRIR